ncbi:MAG: hypothetical protein KGJ41_06845, partial [Rhodospirillales bacterium]|nr:hypothetical protein [Rhodospirillales bacterium]
PMRPLPPPVPAPIAATAPGTATPVPGGLRLVFGPGRSDMNPAMAQAVQSFAQHKPSLPVSVNAVAGGTRDDPSTARRLSLERGLAVRSLLMSQGIASEQIYVKVLAAASPLAGVGPADRVDVIMATAEGGKPVPGTKAGQ